MRFWAKALRIPLSSPALQPTAHEAAGGGVPTLVRTFATAAQYASTLVRPPHRVRAFL